MNVWQRIAVVALALGMVKVANELYMSTQYQRWAKAEERIAWVLEGIDARVVHPQ